MYLVSILWSVAYEKGQKWIDARLPNQVPLTRAALIHNHRYPNFVGDVMALFEFAKLCTSYSELLSLRVANMCLLDVMIALRLTDLDVRAVRHSWN